VAELLLEFSPSAYLTDAKLSRVKPMPQISKELIVIEPAELRAECHIEVAFRKGGTNRGSRSVWHYR
jgi:hypothetical protein